MFFTYVLRGTNSKNKNQIYIGFTKNLKKRLEKHLTKSTQTTAKLKKLKLIYFEACLNQKDAKAREKSLKTGFGRGYLKRRLKDYLKDRSL